jgi:hypothetical protein
MSIKYVGWIDADGISRDELVALGVKGDIKYNFLHCAFEHCECSEEVMETLKKKIKNFFHQSFTAVEVIDGVEKQCEVQKYW